MGDEGNDGTSGEWGAGDDASENEGQNWGDDGGGYDTEGLDDLLNDLGIGPDSAYGPSDGAYGPGGAMGGQGFNQQTDLAGNTRGTFDPNMNVLGPDFDQQVTAAQNARGGRSGASQDAINEYNSLGFNGGLRNSEWTYTDLDGKTGINYGSIAGDLLGLASNPLGSLLGAERMSELGLPASIINGILSGGINIAGYLSGLAPALAGINAVNSGAKGNTTGMLSSLGGLAFGSPGALGGSILGNLTSGRNNSAATSAINAGLSATGNNSLGSMLAGSVNGGQGWGAALAGMLGSGLQSSGISAALNALGVDNRGGLSKSVDEAATNAVNAQDGFTAGGDNSDIATILAALDNAANKTSTSSGKTFTPLYRNIQRGVM